MLIVYLPNDMLSFVLLQATMVQLNLNFTHACQYKHMPTCLLHVKLKNLACICTVVHNFSVHTTTSEHVQHASDAHHELALDFPHYIRQKCFILMSITWKAH